MMNLWYDSIEKQEQSKDLPNILGKIPERPGPTIKWEIGQTL